MKQGHFLNSIFIFTILSLASNIRAEDLPCGDYNVIAKVEMLEGFPVLLINPKTKSQITLSTVHAERPKLTPYLDRNLKAKIIIREAFDKTHGKFESIDDIENSIPDLLTSSGGTAIKLIKKVDCKKTK